MAAKQITAIRLTQADKTRLAQLAKEVGTTQTGVISQLLNNAKVVPVKAKALAVELQPK